MEIWGNYNELKHRCRFFHLPIDQQRLWPWNRDPGGNSPVKSGRYGPSGRSLVDWKSGTSATRRAWLFWERAIEESCCPKLGHRGHHVVSCHSCHLIFFGDGCFLGEETAGNRPLFSCSVWAAGMSSRIKLGLRKTLTDEERALLPAKLCKFYNCFEHIGYLRCPWLSLSKKQGFEVYVNGIEEWLMTRFIFSK